MHVRRGRRSRAALRLITDVAAYGRWTGRWWLPIVLVVVIAVSALATATAKVIVPVALYTLL